MRKNVSLFNPSVSNIGSFDRFLANNDINSVFVDVGDVVDTSTLIICGVSGLVMKDKNYIKNLKKWISDLLVNNVRVIGVCAGMQMLFTYTEESSEEMLGLLQGKVIKLDFSPLKTKTFIGYRELEIPDSKSLSKAYFSHGYGITDFSPGLFSNHITVDLESNQSFLVYFESGNLMGFQFHPERSSEDWRNYMILKIL